MTGGAPNLVIIAAGGTGGHLFPAQALAQELHRRGVDVAFFTDDRGARFSDFFGGLAMYRIAAGNVRQSGVIGRIRAIGLLLRGVCSAYRLLGQLRPYVVVGFGGYPVLPTMVAGLLRRIPLWLHEQNAILGRVNRLVAPWAKGVAVSFPNTGRLGWIRRSKPVVTGNPVRDSIVHQRELPYPALHDDGLFRLLVTGGSQGASIFSDIVPAALTALPPPLFKRIQVTQQCRREDLGRVKAIYKQAGIAAELSEFIADLPERLAWCHLFIGRAGASTVSEAAVIGRPAILVPLPSAADDHQTANANALVARGGGWLVPQPDFTVSMLAKKIRSLLRTPQVLLETAARARDFGQPQAVSRLADLVMGSATAPKYQAVELDSTHGDAADDRIIEFSDAKGVAL